MKIEGDFVSTNIWQRKCVVEREQKTEPMKKILIIAMILTSAGASAQMAYGIKGGLNFGATGDYETIQEGVEDAMTIEGKSKTGYHLGGFARFGFFGIFIQPELVYTRVRTEYNQFEYNLDKIDAPVLLGINLLGPLNIKAGPSFQYVMKNEFQNSNLNVSDVENKITLGYQLGAGVGFGKLGLDLRYEGAFKENTAFSQTASQNFRVDSRPSQWILSLAYSF